MSHVPDRGRVFGLGDHGRGVADIRVRVGLAGFDDGGTTLGEDDVFDLVLDRSVRAFQQQRGLHVDGLVGAATYRVLDEARWRLGDRILTLVAGNLLSGDDVVALQQRLLGLGFKVGRVDGRYGARTEQGVREFQRNIGLPVDGTCGPASLHALRRLAPRVEGGRPNVLRAEEHIRSAGPQLTGKVVALDPAVGAIRDPALRELAREITDDVAARVEGRLVATGVQSLLTPRGDHGAPGRSHDEANEVNRAEFANHTGAHLLVALRVDASSQPAASGVSSYFYGSDAHAVRSTVGERFAGLVQREIVARTDLVDLRSHPKTWDLLRRTRMPAVWVDLGYLTHRHDRRRLQDPAVRDVIAEGIVVAVQRVYLTPETDAGTGVLELGALRRRLRDEARG